MYSTSSLLNLYFIFSFEVLLTAKTTDFKCYSCDIRDSWCYNIGTVEDQGENAMKSCPYNKCAMFGKPLLEYL